MKKHAFIFSSIIYTAITIWLLFFFPFTHASRLDSNVQRTVTLMPLENTTYYFQQAWSYSNKKNSIELLIQVGGNILLFVPFGIILCQSVLRTQPWYMAVIIGLLTSLGVESIQIMTKVGNFDVDDIIWNTSGTLLGFILWKNLTVTSALH